MRSLTVALMTAAASATVAIAAVHGYGPWQSQPKVQGGQSRFTSVAGTCASDGEHTSCYFVGCRAGGDFELLVQSPAGWDNVKVMASAGRFATTVIWKDYPKMLDRLGIATAGGRIDLAFLDSIKNEKRLTMRVEEFRFSVPLTGFGAQLAAMKKKCLAAGR
jgi:hypothetical protein